MVHHRPDSSSTSTKCKRKTEVSSSKRKQATRQSRLLCCIPRIEHIIGVNGRRPIADWNVTPCLRRHPPLPNLPTDDRLVELNCSLKRNGRANRQSRDVRVSPSTVEKQDKPPYQSCMIAVGAIEPSKRNLVTDCYCSATIFNRPIADWNVEAVTQGQDSHPFAKIYPIGNGMREQRATDNHRYVWVTSCTVSKTKIRHPILAA
jgi:hypothetical protein